MTNTHPEAAPPIIQRLEADPRDPDRVVVTIGPADGSPGPARTLLLHIAVVAKEGCAPASPARRTGSCAWKPPTSFSALRPCAELSWPCARAARPKCAAACAKKPPRRK